MIGIGFVCFLEFEDKFNFLKILYNLKYLKKLSEIDMEVLFLKIILYSVRRYYLRC